MRRLGSLAIRRSSLSIADVASVGAGVRVVEPRRRSGSGAVMLLHGGGYVLGTNRDIESKAVMLAEVCGVPVVCPGYRLAPAHPFPAGLDDCHSAWSWATTGGLLDVDPDKIVLGGYSAGGGLAAALAQRLRDDGAVSPVAQVLVYPMLDDRTAARFDLDVPAHPVWSNVNNRYGWSSYLGAAPGGDVPAYAVPARCGDLGGLPPAWIGVGTRDLFLDESRTFAERLTEAGVSVDYVEVEGGVHAFDFEPTRRTRAFDASVAAFVGRHTS